MEYQVQFGALPSPKDVRDYKIASSAVYRTILPEEYNSLNEIAVKNQGGVSSCVAHAVSTILEYHAPEHPTLSTNFIYGGQYLFCERPEDGRGMYMRDACKIVKKYGDPLEKDCRGNSEFQDCYDKARAASENTEIMDIAYNYRIQSYVDVSGIDEIKYAIYTHGPVLVCLKWYNDIIVDKKGIMKSAKDDGSGYGHHAVVLYGWNKDGFLLQNSWGTGWGQKGRAILPYDYPIAEAKCIVDTPNIDIVMPRKGKLFEVCYKIINFFWNLFTALKKR